MKKYLPITYNIYNCLIAVMFLWFWERILKTNMNNHIEVRDIYLFIAILVPYNTRCCMLWYDDVRQCKHIYKSYST